MSHRPRNHRRRLSASMALMVGLSTLVAPTSALAVGPPPAPVPVLDWTPCGEGLQCATARVPLDYSQPQGSTISLSLIRKPATDPAHRIGSLFLNPGGPGGSGVEAVRRFSTAIFPPQLHAQFDLVGFDPRGVHLSSPVRCFADQPEQAAFMDRLPSFPVGEQEETDFLAAMRQFDQLCLARNATLLPHMSTANTARDLDLLRQAVGDEKLNYLGLSYGTFLGTTYANLFPSRVRALILDGVVDPIAWTTGHESLLDPLAWITGRDTEASRLPVLTRLKSHLGASQTLAEFLRLCEQSGPAGCAFAAESSKHVEPKDLGDKFAALLARIREHPVVIHPPGGDSVTVTYALLVSDVLAVLYAPAAWPPGAQLLQQLWQLTVGDPEANDSTIAAILKKLTPPAPPDYDNAQDALGAIACADSTNPTDPGAWPRAAHQADAQAPYFGAAWTWLSVACAAWGAQDRDRYQGPWTATTSSPVLMIGSRFDPATRYESAVTLHRLLPRSRLVTLEGWGHTSVFGPSACAAQFEVGYLVSGQLPPEGAVCKPDHVPFTPLPTDTAAATKTSASFAPNYAPL